MAKRFQKILTLVFILAAPYIFAQNLDERLVLASPDVIAADAALKNHMETLAKTAVNEHCAGCHGTDLTGKVGVPNLVDFDWLWGVTGFEMTQSEAVFEIMQTILYGVRNTDCPDDIKRYGGCPDTRFSQMPGYAQLGFTDTQLNVLVDYVLGLAGNDHDAAAVESVANLIPLCAECHGEDGRGYKAFGGPDLSDDVWLFGDSREQVFDVIANGRTESCPAWSNVLSAAEIKALAVSIYNQSMGY
jgi:cytochrome c oxidase cbb3-type subunit 3